MADEPKKPIIPISQDPNRPDPNPELLRVSALGRATSYTPLDMAAKLRADQEKAMGETIRQTLDRVVAESPPITELSETGKQPSPHSAGGETVVSGHSDSTSTPFTVFDYLGLGFILEPPAVVVHAVMTGETLQWANVVYALPFVALGAIFIAVGRNWQTLKERTNSRFVGAVDALSRSYIVPFVIVLFALSGVASLPIWIWRPNRPSPASHSSATADEIAVAVVKALPVSGAPPPPPTLPSIARIGGESVVSMMNALSQWRGYVANDGKQRFVVITSSEDQKGIRELLSNIIRMTLSPQIEVIPQPNFARDLDAPKLPTPETNGIVFHGSDRFTGRLEAALKDCFEVKLERATPTGLTEYYQHPSDSIILWVAIGDGSPLIKKGACDR